MKPNLTLSRALTASLTLMLVFLFQTPAIANDPTIEFESHDLCPGSEVTVEVNVSNFNNIGALRLEIPVDTEKVSEDFAIVNKHPALSTLLASYNASIEAFVITWYAQSAGHVANIGNDKIFDIELTYLGGTQELDLSDIPPAINQGSYIIYWGAITVTPIVSVPGTLTPLIDIDQQPEDTEVNAGDPATFNVSVSPPFPTPSYQWQKETPDGWTDLEDNDEYSGTTTSQLTKITTTQDDHATFYRVVAERLGCFVTSEDAQLLIADLPDLYRLRLKSEPDEGGETEGGGMYEEGEEILVTASPNFGYDFVEWTDSDNNTLSDDLSFTYTMPASNVTLFAHFELTSYTITSLAGDGGAIDPEGVTEVTHGDDITFDFIPDEGYEISDVTVDNESVGTPESYTFENVTQDHSIEVQFQLQQHTITAVPNNPGYGSVTGDGVYDHFEEATLTAVPEDNYNFLNWTENGEVVSTEEEYVFTVVEDRNLVAHFALDVVEINAVPNDDSYGSVEGAGNYEIGLEVTLTATAAEGHHFINWTEDGDEVAGTETYVFTAETDRDLVANFAVNTYTLIYTAGENGSLEGETNQTVEHGNDGTPVEAIPDTGYHFTAWSDGVTDNPRTDTNVVDDIEVMAEFAVNTYVITASSSEGGTIDPEGEITVTHGADQAFTITPDEINGFEIADVLVDGQSQGAITSYTFEDVTEDHEIEAIFALREYVITASSTEGGTIDPEGDVTVTHGDDQVFAITPDDAGGYEIIDVLLDGQSQGAITSYTFQNVTEDHEIEAIFALREYTITASSNEGGTIDPEGDVTVTHGDDKTFTITAEEENGFEIKDVLVDGQSVGAVESYTFENVTTGHEIEAVFGLKVYEITATAGEGGEIDPVGVVTVTHGGDLTFDITPDEANGYEIEDVITDGESQGNISSYTFTNVTSDHTIEAQFTLKTYVITATAGDNGSISPEGDVVVEHGSDQAFSITPETGYHISALIVDGSPVEEVSEFTFENVTQDHTIHAEFAPNVYTITATASEGGTINPAGDVFVNHGANRTFTFTSDEGYHISDVLIDDISIGVTGSYTFTNVTKDHTIHVEFAINTYTLLYSAGENGSLIGDTDQEVDHGEDGTPVEAVADDGYHFTEWSDGVTDNPRTDTGVTGDLDVTAHFAINTYVITASAGDGGNINPDGDVEVNHGDNQAFAITPDEGYEIDDVLVDGTSVGDVDSYTFENVTGDHTIEAFFALKTYVITASAGDNGSISPEGDVEVTHGDDQAFTISPASGYHVSELIVDGNNVEPATSYTFENVTQDHTIHAEFALNTYIITASSSDGGHLDPEGDVEVDHGANKAFSIHADEGYFLEDLLVDGESQGTPGSYTFINVTTNHTIEAIFAIHTYTLLYNAGENGTIEGDTEQTVEHGADGTPVQAIPDADYHFVEWSDGSADNPRTDTNVTEDLEVTALFALTTYELSFVVQDAAGDPIHDAVITLNEVAYGEGEYVFPGLVPDTYIYNVSREGYFDVSGEVVVDSDKEVSVTMQVDDTSVPHTEPIDLKVYPNPASDIVTVEAARPIDEVRVVDMLGRTVYSASPGEQQYALSVRNMKPGIYFVRVSAGDKTETLRLRVSW